MFNLPPTFYPAIQALVLKGIIRSMDTSMAIGFAIASSLDLPETKSDVPESFFLGTYGEVADEILCCLNDIAPIDYKATRSYAAKFFALRHTQRFGICELPMHSENNIYDMYGFTTHLSNNEIEAMATQNGEFAKQSKLFCMIISECTK